MEGHFNLKKFTEIKDSEQRIISLKKKKEFATLCWHLDRNDIQSFFTAKVFLLVKYTIKLSAIEVAFDFGNTEIKCFIFPSI